ncbi:MAG TPA: response regulator [Nitrospiraceae bacterium]|nr:response regulator [Nitrospiraceae bacterium]
MASILIIDDESEIRDLLRLTLERAGHRVSEATNGREGMAQYRSAPTDVVLVDIMMPVQDGLETILALTREFINTKVIAMTGATGNQSKLDVAKLLGARHTFLKPFNMQTMLSTIDYELTH